MRSETAALVVSTLAALAIGVVATAAAVLSSSQAILLDGLYNLAFFVTALFTLRVARLIERPDDDRYPFGYLYFEPLINTVKGFLILGVSGFALIDAVLTLLRGGRSLILGPALAYAVAATVACIATWLVLRRANARLRSPLLAADVGNWAVNALISAGVLLAFLLALALEQGGRSTAAAYVDPALVAIVVLISLAVPIRIAVEGLMALLNRSPPDAVTRPIAARVRAALATLPTRAIYVRIVKPGRTTYVTVHALVEPDTRLDLAAADALRRAVVAALAHDHAPVIADIVFTAVDEFAAPTTGFAAAHQASGT